MKESVFSLQNGVYHCVVNEVLSFLAANGVGTMVVGGVAVQAHTLKMAADAKLLLPNDFIRKTDDLDLVVTSALDQEAILGAMKKLAERFDGFVGEAGETLFEVNMTRVGAVKPLLRVTYVSADGQEHIDDIKLNLSPPSDNQTIDPAFQQDKESITLSHIECASNLTADVICLEHLVMNKLAKAREKDLVDAGKLADVIKKTDAGFSTEKADEAFYHAKDCSKELRNRYHEFLRRAGKSVERKPKPKGLKISR